MNAPVLDKVITEPARETPVLMEADIVVVGGGTTGPLAAIAAARRGKSVVMIERFGSLGGNLTLGLNTKPSGALVGGLPLEIWNLARSVGGAGEDYMARVQVGRREDRLALRSRDHEDAADPALRRCRRADPVRDLRVDARRRGRLGQGRDRREQERPPVHRLQGADRLLGRRRHGRQGGRALRHGRRRRGDDDAAGLHVLHHGPCRHQAPGRMGAPHRRRAGAGDPGEGRGSRLRAVAHRLQRLAAQVPAGHRHQAPAREHHAEDGGRAALCERDAGAGRRHLLAEGILRRDPGMLPAGRCLCARS